MSRGLRTTIAILAVLVVFGLITLPSLRQAIRRISAAQRTEEQARRDVMQVPVSTPSDVNVKAQMYWLSAASPVTLEASTIELPLSADPVERSKQLLVALITNVPSPSQRTLPADAILLAFYLQPDGTGVADFSDALSAETPSGIQSEQLAIDSIARTLGAPAVSELTLQAVQTFVDDVVVVDDRDAVAALVELQENLGVLVEPAASCTYAALRLERVPKTEQTLLLLCGSNLRIDEAAAWKQRFLG